MQWILNDLKMVNKRKNHALNLPIFMMRHQDRLGSSLQRRNPPISTGKWNGLHAHRLQEKVLV